MCPLYLVFTASMNAPSPSEFVTLRILLRLAKCHVTSFPLSCWLLLGCFYFWLDAERLHQSLEYPRLLGYGAGGREGGLHAALHIVPIHPLILYSKNTKPFISSL